VRHFEEKLEDKRVELEEKDNYILKLQLALKQLRESVHSSDDDSILPLPSKEETKETKKLLSKVSNGKTVNGSPATKQTTNSGKIATSASAARRLSFGVTSRSPSPPKLDSEDGSTKSTSESESEEDLDESVTTKPTFKPIKGDEVDNLLAKLLVEYGLQSLPLSRTANATYEIADIKGLNGKKYNMKILNGALMIRPPGSSYIKFEQWAKTMGSKGSPAPRSETKKGKS